MPVWRERCYFPFFFLVRSFACGALVRECVWVARFGTERFASCETRPGTEARNSDPGIVTTASVISTSAALARVPRDWKRAYGVGFSKVFP
ncbi:hypothetical protein PoB_000333200 [Plakobranchus ocellatus]|uniref:Secreted protein n=1 Tax=Plakobranchus ocellatus TaxID=259542 RepID=A0AAV3Y2Z7_9GAST|nr:hypothetical protein PoB_000333200 [Plakobranchus ocellatus]